MRQTDLLDQEDDTHLCCEGKEYKGLWRGLNTSEIGGETSEGNIQSHNMNLPQGLKVLFGLNGATLSLPMMASMSLLNNRIAIPPAYLSVYGAVSFLPYSLKPIYGAIMTTKLFSHSMLPRHAIISFLLLCSSLSFLAFAYLTSHAVVLCILFGFLNGLSTSWPEFLLGIALLDAATHETNFVTEEEKTRDTTTTTTRFIVDSQLDKVNVIEPTQPREEAFKMEDDVCETNKHDRDFAVAIFQSQAATCRNLGSILASSITFIFFICSKKDMDDHTITLFYVATAILPLLGSFVAWKYRVGTFGCSSPSSSSLRQNLPEVSSIKNTRRDTKETLDVTAGNDQYDSRRKRHKKDNIEYRNIHEESESSPDFITMQNDKFNLFQTRHLLILSIILFQVSLIWFSLRRLIISNSSSILWNVIFMVFLMGMMCSAIPIIYRNYFDKLPNNNMLPSNQLRPIFVAIFLILRHSIPEPTYVLSSFFYLTFEKRPIYLQAMSLLGNMASTLSTWIFGKIVSKCDFVNNGFKSLKIFIVVITIITSILSLSKMPLIDLIQKRADDSVDDASFLPISYFVYHGLLILVSSFLGELWFMPSVILASLSVNGFEKGNTHKVYTAPPHHEVEECEVENSNGVTLDNTVGGNTERSFGDTNQSSQATFGSLNEGIQYGILISCIDFGDQMSDWIVVPIISQLGISQENGWKNLNWLICLCSLMSIFSLLSLPLLRTTKYH